MTTDLRSNSSVWFLLWWVRWWWPPGMGICFMLSKSRCLASINGFSNCDSITSKLVELFGWAMTFTVNDRM